jgi:hypothetical protein
VDSRASGCGESGVAAGDPGGQSEAARREEAKTALAESGVSALADTATPEIDAAGRIFAELG